MIARVRELDIAVGVTHGLGRRPSKADRTPIDPAALAEWTARNRRAVEFNRRRPKREAAADLILRREEAQGDS